ncbi:Lar family restriction alleviation protein [Variovorax sp. J31P207]|uniref:Lar family restriction alleviation protein n=1 Tax=Variovorax sp. J31P207 TaxID=3053510 RepID=UPI002578C233|nr:Lar family restriction alleviation protein [Variovorax sp. J31P207]MDM0072082.1 Lar family restriction alleviation protein [Variovorax sp. J31P207]
MTADTQAQGDLAPCPFCGGDACRAKTMDESLWSHATVPYYKVYCPECNIGTDYLCEGYEPTAEEAWNNRAAALQGRGTQEGEPSDAMLAAAVKEAVKQGLVPKYAAGEEAFVKHWSAVEAVVRAALAQAQKEQQP